MTREQLEALGMSDRDLVDEFKRVAATLYDSRVSVPVLAGADTVERQLARADMFEQVTFAWYSDPGVP